MILRILAVLTVVPALATAETEPCTKATTACWERVGLGSEGRFVNVYRSFALTLANSALRTAYVMIHGAGRNADGYFATALASTFLAGRLKDTLVIAPRFAGNDGSRCKDPLDSGEMSWTCNGWAAGERPVDNTSVSSYDLIDKLVEMMSNRKMFPNLTRIVLAGHSAGGQFMNRYSAVARASKSAAVPIQYVVSNPSSYLYFDKLRPAPGTKCSEKGECSGDFVEYAGAEKCAAFNRWRYGMEQRTGYASAVEESAMRSQLAARDVIYLLSELDTLPIAGFDSSCPAMAQGPTRLERGVAYWNYAKTRLGANHRLATVPLCGHNARCVFTSDQALKVVFPE
jgi:pimeloyl-ACP methyl ester carboxylesterase